MTMIGSIRLLLFCDNYRERNLPMFASRCLGRLKLNFDLASFDFLEPETFSSLSLKGLLKNRLSPYAPDAVMLVVSYRRFLLAEQSWFALLGWLFRDPPTPNFSSSALDTLATLFKRIHEKREVHIFIDYVYEPNSRTCAEDEQVAFQRALSERGVPRSIVTFVDFKKVQEDRKRNIESEGEEEEEDDDDGGFKRGVENLVICAKMTKRRNARRAEILKEDA